MFTGNISHEVNKFMEALNTMTNFDDTKKTKLRKKFKKALFYQNPDKAFTFIGSGVYKRCYALDDEKQFVIKFCSPYDIDHEIATLEHAAEDGVKELFIDGFYFNISCCSMSDDYNFVVIQPRIAFVAEKDPMPGGNYSAYYDYEYESHPLYDENNEKISFCNFSDTRVDCVAWLQAVINIYGMNMFDRFCAFVNKYDIDDLHTENIAYMECEEGGFVPIIIDWMAFNI